MLVSVSATKAAFTSGTILAESCSKTKPKATTTAVRFTVSELALLAISAAVTTTVIAVAKVAKNCSS